MKNYIITIAILAAFSINVAQGGQKQENRMENRLEYLSIVLDLSDDQITDIRHLQQEHIVSVNDIRAEYESVIKELEAALTEVRLQSEGNFDAAREAAKDIREGFKPQLDPMKEAIKSERNSFNEVLAQVFSDEQQEIFDALKAFKEENRAMDRKHPGKH